MMNAFENIPAESEFRYEMTQSFDEQLPESICDDGTIAIPDDELAIDQNTPPEFLYGDEEDDE